VRRTLADFAPDVVHLASPFELGRRYAGQLINWTYQPWRCIKRMCPGTSESTVFGSRKRAWQRIIAIHQSATRTRTISFCRAAAGI
jgi:hypothetical protein